MKWHLLLDFDDAEAIPGFWTSEPEEMGVRAHAIIKKRLARAGYKVNAWAFEESTNGWHAKVSLEQTPDSPMEVVALQAICGSDPLRESCNVSRARAAQEMMDEDPDAAEFWRDRWNVLYAPNPNRRKMDDAS